MGQSLSLIHIFKSLTDTSIGITKDDLKIHIQPDKDSRTPVSYTHLDVYKRQV